ncbi:MAG TPA: hypothetical protein PK600_05470 [Deltaproteobacteria bacterium]|nr:hypothetical protein [Deltaproteobacteria bacterium]
MMGSQVTTVQENTGALVALGDLEKMAQYMVKSQLFGIKTQEQAVALMLIAQAEGLHPAIAARDYHIIQGRHSLKSDAMLARFQQAGGIVEWDQYTNEKVSAWFSHPSSPKKVFVDWDMVRAKSADLGGKDNWKKYPRQMLRARVISEGIRTVFPGIAVGVYTPEEVQDFEEEPKPPRNITPARPAAQKPQTQTLKEKLKGEASPEAEAVLLITEDDASTLRVLLTKAQIAEKFFLDEYKIEKIEDLPADKLDGAIDRAQARIDRIDELAKQKKTGSD